jgi:hypothetical protein
MGIMAPVWIELQQLSKLASTLVTWMIFSYAIRS